MGAYKWYLIVNNVFYFVIEWVYGVVHPEPLFPYPILLGRGLSRYIPSTDFSRNLYMNFGIFLAVSAAYFMIAQFVFRYAQTTESWIYNVFSSFKYSAMLYAASMSVVIATVIVPLGLNWASKDELLAYIRDIDEQLYQKMQKTPCIVGMKTASPLSYTIAASAAVAFSLTGTLVAVLSTLSCYRFLRNNRRSLSMRTAALYRSLISALVLDVFVGFLMIIVPMLVSMAALTFHNAYGSIIALMSMSVVIWYPLLTHVILLANVRPYRMALTELFRKVILGNMAVTASKKRSTRVSSQRYRDSFIAF